MGERKRGVVRKRRGRERENERTNERTIFLTNEGNGISTILFYIQPSRETESCITGLVTRNGTQKSESNLGKMRKYYTIKTPSDVMHTARPTRKYYTPT